MRGYYFVSRQGLVSINFSIRHCNNTMVGASKVNHLVLLGFPPLQGSAQIVILGPATLAHSWPISPTHAPIHDGHSCRKKAGKAHTHQKHTNVMWVAIFLPFFSVSPAQNATVSIIFSRETSRINKPLINYKYLFPYVAVFSFPT